jgi:biopolymer transport protein ExbD
MKTPNLRSRRLEMNMTPMIDVVFLLIIFFLVSSHLVQQQNRLKLDLPVASGGDRAVDDERPRVVINVLPTGELRMEGSTVTKEDVARILREEVTASGGDLEVRIRGDRATAYKNVEPILTAAAKTGLWNVTLAVVEPR